jgi:inosine-uridine nucleoside N-ribohydrolase
VGPSAIIDCDPGHDDVMAILLAARTLDLRGITTVHGNTTLVNTTLNARKTVEFADLRHVPIAAGMARPLVRDEHNAPEVHGKTGLDGPTLPAPTVPILDQHAVDFIIDRSHADAVGRVHGPALWGGTFPGRFPAGQCGVSTRAPPDRAV